MCARAGGCCRTGPSDIVAFRQAVDDMRLADDDGVDCD